MNKPAITPSQPLIIPDTMALIQLAAGRRLSLLPQMGKLVIVDMVEHEAVRFFSKPFAPNIGIWASGLEMAAPKGEVQIAATQQFKNFRVQEAQNPAYKESHAGENAIFEWMNAQTHFQTTPIILSNERKVAQRVAVGASRQHAQVMNVEVFLQVAQKQGLVSDVAQEMQAIARAVQAAQLRQNQKKWGGQTP